MSPCFLIGICTIEPSDIIRSLSRCPAMWFKSASESVCRMAVFYDTAESLRKESNRGIGGKYAACHTGKDRNRQSFTAPSARILMTDDDAMGVLIGGSR